MILAPHDEPDAISRNLPAIMSQKYPAGFQIIVVVEEGENETEDVLKRFQQQLDKEPADCTIYITYIPQSSRYVSRKKLAMTLGVKAAKTEWLIMTEPVEARFRHVASDDGSELHQQHPARRGLWRLRR